MTLKAADSAAGSWSEGTLPLNVRLGRGTLISGLHPFRQFRATIDPALIIGENGTFTGTTFALGKSARVTIGDHACFSTAILLCEQELTIGSYVMLGWNVTIADTDFHPLAPAERVADAIACSPLGEGRPRPPILTRPVVIEDNVWVGPNASIFKGVRIGAGAWIEPGAMVTCDVSPGARVLGNPAREVDAR